MDIDNSKLGTELNLAINTPEEERNKSLDLNVGYIEQNNEWELIIKYTGNAEKISSELNVSIIELLNGYGIIRIPEEKVGELSVRPEILFIDKPKSLVTGEQRVIEGYSASCMSFLQRDDNELSGNGVLVAVIDSGIDYKHEVFRRDGTTNIRTIWDQTQPGNPPIEYGIGTLYSEEDINTAVNGEGESLLTYDGTGHGTAVASIVSNCAPGAELIIVKLDTGGSSNLPTTAALMLAIDFSVREARKYNIPLVINLSFGNNYGDHSGNSILEDYINSISGIYKLSIIVGTGNDGDSGRHTQISLIDSSWKQIDFIVGEYETGINLQIWRKFSDNIDILIRTPGGEEAGPFSYYQQLMDYEMKDMNIRVINGYPSPININQETYISIIPKKQYIETGIWSIFIKPKSITDGRVDIWLPVLGSTSSNVSFLSPSVFTTLTIPSTAERVISVGAYDSISLSYASFSGRGYTLNGQIKPDIVAPGVDIDVAIPGNGYGKASGTSFATPFVSAGAAIMMEEGIVNNNDPFLYGEKIKAKMIKGARKLPGVDVWPNEKLGWGAFCLEDSMI